MAETFDSINIITQDGAHEIGVTNVPREQRLENFKSRVAMELGRAERRYINPEELDLFLFGEMLEDKDRTLADYGLKDGAFVTRIDHFNGSKVRAPSTTSTTTTTDVNLPPYPGPPVGKLLHNVFVKLGHRTINLHGLTTTSTIQELYDKLKKETKISQASTGLVYGTKQLKADLALQDYHIGEDSTIFVFDKLPGGSSC